MKSTLFILMTALFTMIPAACGAAKPKKVLIFTETKEFFHTNIPFATKATKAMLEEKGFAVDTTRQSDGFFTPEKLKEYASIIFINTTGKIFDDQEKEALKGYMKNGGGYVGVHGASDTEKQWEYYYRMSGGTFLSHPQQQEAGVKVVDKKHPATAFLPDEWKNFDEWYDFANFNQDVTVLAWLDETSYKGGKMGEKHPFIWCHEYEGGRAFYTGLGHTEECFKSPLFLQHLYEAVKWSAKIK